MRGILNALVVAVMLVGVVLAFSRCAHSGQELEFAGGAIMKDCGAGALQDVSDVRSWIHNGGDKWEAVLADAINCLVPVALDELAAHGVGEDGAPLPTAVASSSPTPMLMRKPPLAPGELDRARFALAVGRRSVRVRR